MPKLSSPRWQSRTATTFIRSCKLDRFADGSFSFDFTDKLAVFLAAVYRSTDDLRVHELLWDRLLVLGHTHSRWFMRDRFIEVVRLGFTNAHYTPMVARLLRETPGAAESVRDAVEQLSLPVVIQEALVG